MKKLSAFHAMGALFLSLFFSLPVFGMYGDNYFSLGLGYLQRDYMRLMNSDQGILPPRTESTAPTIQIGYAFSTENFNWAPELHYSLPKKDSIDGGTETSYLGLKVPVIKDFQSLGPEWKYSYGFSYYRYTMKGSGGTIALTNLGAPQDFDLPSRSVTTQFLTLDWGISYQYEYWSFGANLMVEKFFSNTKRSLSYLIDIKYNWK